MRKLNSCVIVADERALRRHRQNFMSAPYASDRRIASNVIENGLQFVGITTGTLPAQLQQNCDLLLVEDEWIPAAILASRAAQCHGINNVVIATSPSVVERLLDSDWSPSPIVTLDFLLRKRLNESGKPDWPAAYSGPS